MLLNFNLHDKSVLAGLPPGTAPPGRHQIDPPTKLTPAGTISKGAADNCCLLQGPALVHYSASSQARLALVSTAALLFLLVLESALAHKF